MLPYWLASRPIKGRASALSVLQSESYLLTDQLCNNHVQHSRTLLTLTGGHLDLWPYEQQPRVFFLWFYCWYWKCLKWKSWDHGVVKKCINMLGKMINVSEVYPRRPEVIVFCRPRSVTDCPYSRLISKFSFFAKSANYFNHRLLFFLRVLFIFCHFEVTRSCLNSCSFSSNYDISSLGIPQSSKKSNCMYLGENSSIDVFQLKMVSPKEFSGWI